MCCAIACSAVVPHYARGATEDIRPARICVQTRRLAGAARASDKPFAFRETMCPQSGTSPAFLNARWRTVRAKGNGGMDREQLIQRLRARVRRGGPAEQVWWNGELLHVSEALMRAADLSDHETIRARGDDVVIPRMLRDDQ